MGRFRTFVVSAVIITSLFHGYLLVAKQPVFRHEDPQGSLGRSRQSFADAEASLAESPQALRDQAMSFLDRHGEGHADIFESASTPQTSSVRMPPSRGAPAQKLVPSKQEPRDVDPEKFTRATYFEVPAPSSVAGKMQTNVKNKESSVRNETRTEHRSVQLRPTTKDGVPERPVHRVRSLGDRLPYFLHFHKAGGTTLCHYARVVNKLNSPIRNCNLPGDGPRTLEEGIKGFANRDLECGKRMDYLKRHCIEFFASERWLDDTFCAERFLYMTILRDPVKRIESNCRFEKVQPAKALGWLEVTHLPPERVYLGTAAVDNFYIRSLCGHEVFHLPAGSINRGHLDMAKERLHSFEIILILEELLLGTVQTERVLRWKPPSPDDAQRSWGRGDESIRFSDGQRAKLREKNALDVELYQYAILLSRNITAAVKNTAQDVLFSGPRKRQAGCGAAFEKWSEAQRRNRNKRRG